MVTNNLRITGLASGLDTEEMIRSLMKAENMRVDKLKQNVQLMEWTRDSYRDISNLLRVFKDEYFDVLKPDSNMRSLSVFSAFESTYNGASTSNYLTVKAGADASAGNYSIKSISTATTAKLSGGTLASGIKGVGVSNISSAQDNNKVTVTFNGTSKVITLADNSGDISALVTDLQTKINATFGENKIIIGNEGDQLTFVTDNTNTLSFSYAYNSGHADLLGKDLSEGITLDDGNNKFKLTLGTEEPVDIVLDTVHYENTDAIVEVIQSKVDGNKIRVYNLGGKVALKAVDGTAESSGTLASQEITESNEITQENNELTVKVGEDTKTFTLIEKTYTQQELLSAVQGQLDKEFGANEVLVTLGDDGKLRFEAISEEKLSTSPMENGGLQALGLASANKSNKIDLNASLADIKEKNNSELNIDTIKFTINGEDFQFASTDSLSDIINQVNNNANANVKMKYDQLNDKFVIESKQTGVTAKVNISDVDGSNLMAVLGFDDGNNSASGTDAKVEVNFNDGNGYQVIERSTNNFTINGLTFDLKQNFSNTTGEAGNDLSLGINANSDKAIETIKGFVEKYNEVLDKVNEQLSQKRYRDYQPLTEDQKKDMSEKEIELWEEKAKSGLLRSDPLLDRIVNSMRSALYSQVEGVGISLYDIGIKTGSWEQKGKLVIAEEKLKAALAENPSQVAQLFTQKSDVSYNEAMDDSSKSKTRYAQSGLAERLYDIIQDNIRTTRNSGGQKGLLLEKAGIKNDGTEFDNLINDQIERENDRIDRLLDQLVNKENYYYNMFARMEAAIQQMNTQSMWLAQQFGGGA